MLKAKKISAVALELSDGVEAVFVQEGPDWNGLTAHRCIAPGAFVGQMIITAPDPSSGGAFSVLFDEIIFGRLQTSIIVMASPDIASVIKAIGMATATSPRA